MRGDPIRRWIGQLPRRPLSSRRPLVVDGAAAAALASLALVSAALEPSDALSGVTRPFDAAAVLLVLAMTAPLVARRRLPRTVAVFTTVVAAGTVVAGYPVGIGPFGAVFALHSLAYATSNRTTVAVGVPGGVLLLAGLLGSPGDLNPASVAGNGLFIFVALALGALLRINNAQRNELIRRNRELTTAREAQVRSAVNNERLRIAREVHDAVGHALVAVTLQARAGQRRLDRNPGAARAALAEIELLAQQALHETRVAVTTIRADAQDPVVVPRLSVASLNALVESMRASEVDIDLDVRVDGGDLHPEQERAAFRIVQESLSNVAKHAGPARARVTVSSDGGTLHVEVTDNGRSGRRPAAAGSGIHGMRERAERLGGGLVAGPTPTGWRVRAVLPAERDVPAAVA